MGAVRSWISKMPACAPATRNEGAALIKTDFHIHPNYSFDATHESIDLYCRRAFELGLSQICFTPHYTTVPEVIDKYGFARKDGKKFPVTGDWLADYIADVRAADRKYSRKGLRVFAGLEVDYSPAIHESLKKRLTEEYSFDFLLGSVHVIKGGLDIMVQEESHDIFGRMTREEFYDTYFENVELTAGSGLFSAMAHLEGYKRFGAKINPEYSDESLIPEKRFEKVFRIMAGRGMAVEINLSLFRSGLDTINPVEKVLGIARDCGVSTATIGSDAHRVADLAFHIDDALAACEKMGFRLYTL